jgi:hypothetical protein
MILWMKLVVCREGRNRIILWLIGVLDSKIIQFHYITVGYVPYADNDFSFR